MDYHRQDKVDIRIARIFNTYGPRMAESDGRVVSNFIVQALRGAGAHAVRNGRTDPLLLLRGRVGGRPHAPHGGGEPARAGQPGQSRRVHHSPAGRRGRSAPSARASGSNISLFRQDDPTQRKPDITRAREWLGWEPKIQLSRGTRADGRVLPPTACAGAEPAPAPHGHEAYEGRLQQSNLLPCFPLRPSPGFAPGGGRLTCGAMGVTAPGQIAALDYVPNLD